MSKVKKYSLLVVTALLLCVSFVVGGLMISGNSEKVNAETNTFEMVEKASAPINTECGLRFRVKMDATTKEKVVRTEEPESLSVIFLSKEVYDAGIDKGLSHAQIYDVVKDDYCVEVSIDPEKVYEEDGFWYANAVLTKIQYKKWNFVAFAKFGENFTGNYAYNNLYNVINSAFKDTEEGITEKILKNTSYSWYGNSSFPVVVNNETELNRIYTRCENDNIVIKTSGFIATEDVYALNRIASQTFTLDETPTGTFTTNIDGFIASVSENVLTVTKDGFAGSANGLVLKVSNGNGFVKYISLVDYAIGNATEFDAWYSAYINKDANACGAIVILTDNIDMTNGDTYDTETATTAFTGMFIGNGFNVNGLKSKVGVFGRLNGTFANVSFTNMTTSKQWYPMLGGISTSGAKISNVYLDGTLPNGDHTSSKQSNAFFNAIRNSTIENVVVIAKRGGVLTASDTVSQFAESNNIENLYVVDTANISGSASKNVTDAKCYGSVADFANGIKVLPAGFDTKYWRIGSNGGIVFKSAGENLPELAEEIGVFANNKEFYSSSSKEIPESFDIDFGIDEAPVKVYANGNEIDFTNKSSGVITINPKAIYTTYGANDYLISIRLSDQAVGYKLVLASFEVSNADEFKWLFSAESLKIDGVGASLFDGRTGGYGWPDGSKVSGSYIIVTNDIDAGGFASADLHTLSGKLDGRNHVISNFTAAWNGLFYTLETTGVIKNLAMINVKFSNGSAQIFGNKIAGVLENCYFEATGGVGHSILTNNLGASAIIKNVVVIGYYLGADISNNPKIAKNNITAGATISNFYVVTESTNAYIAGTQPSYAGVNAYSSIDAYKSAITEVPSGFDTKYWSIGSFGLCRENPFFKVPSFEGYYTDNLNGSVVGKKLTADSTYTVEGFDKVYKAEITHGAGASNALLADFGYTVLSNKYDAWGFAFMITGENQKFIANSGDSITANTWYYVLCKNLDDRNMMYLSTISAGFGYVPTVLSSDYQTNRNYFGQLENLFKFYSSAESKFDFYVTDIKVVYPKTAKSLDGSVLMGDDSKTYTEKFFSSNVSQETIAGFDKVYEKDCAFNHNVQETDATCLSCTDWDGVYKNFANYKFAMKVTKDVRLGSANGYTLKANVWYYVMCDGTDWWLSTDGANYYKTGNWFIEGWQHDVDSKFVNVSGTAMQFHITDVADKNASFKLYITDFIGNLA